MQDNIKILLVDDNIDTLDAMRDRLEYQGYDVEFAIDGAEAWDKAQRANWDLIILDIMMPKANGYEVLKKIRCYDKTKDIPVIMASAKNEEGNIEYAKHAGAQGYICKPFKMAELLSQIQLSLEGELSIRRGFDIARIKSLKVKMKREEQKKMNCWEYMKCGRELGGFNVEKGNECIASIATMADGVNGGKNAGRCCWAVAGSLTMGKPLCVKANEYNDCLLCLFFKKVEDEEDRNFSLFSDAIEQAKYADSFSNSNKR